MINNLKGKGIFVFSDPGGAKPIMALIKLNRLKNYKVFSDREYSFFKDFNLKVEIRKSYFAKEIIKKNNPDYIFTGTSYTSKIELRFLLEGKKQKIKTYSFIDHYTRYKERFFLNGENIFPDTVFLTDKKAKKLAKIAGITKHTKVEVSGNFYHEFLKKWKPNKPKKYILPTIKSNQKIILFAPDPLSNINGKKNYLFDETDVWIALSEAVNKYLNDLEILILIKFHPNQNISYLKKTISQTPTKSVIISNNINLNSIIYYSDIIIGTYSSLLVEATFLKKMIIRYIPNPENEDWLLNLNVGQTCHKIKDLADSIRSSLL